MKASRVLKVVGIFVAIVLALIAWLFVVGPTARLVSFRGKVRTAIKQAKHVRLEEYTSISGVLGKRELAPHEFNAVVDALPLGISAGFDKMILMRCFIPHHRVMIESESGSSFEFLICFGCEQVRAGGPGILSTPDGWRQPLRNLFTSRGLQVRSLDEYSDLDRKSLDADPSGSVNDLSSLPVE